MTVKKDTLCQVWWLKPLIPALGTQRQADICEFEASLVYRVSSRAARATQRNPVSKTNKQNKTKQKTDPITDDCEPPCCCWELNTGPLDEQSVLLTTEPSLQPPLEELLWSEKCILGI